LSKREKACSAVETVFPPGALSTRMPRRVAVSTSTLSTPTPPRPTTRNFPAAFSTPAVTFVSLPTIKAPNSGMIWISFSFGSFVWTETSRVPSRESSSTPPCEIKSAMRTFGVTADVQRSVSSAQLREDLDLGGLRKHIERRYRFDLETPLQVGEVACERGGIT